MKHVFLYDEVVQMTRLGIHIGFWTKLQRNLALSWLRYEKWELSPNQQKCLPLAADTELVVWQGRGKTVGDE